MEKIQIADKQFTMKYPSFKRTQKVSEMMADLDKIGSDWEYAKEIVQTMVEEDVNILNENYENDTIGIGDIVKVQNDFFTSTVKTVGK